MILNKKVWGFFVLAALAVFLAPDVAWAGEGIGEFASPMKKVMDTLTGTTAKYISIAAMAATGFTLFFGRNELDNMAKVLLGVVFAIAFVAFASPIVSSVFGSGFEGALL